MSKEQAPLSRHVRVDASPARLARIWDAVAGRLDERPTRLRRGWYSALSATALVVALAIGVRWLSDGSAGPSVLERAALETAGDGLAVDLEDGSKLELAARTRVKVIESQPDSTRLGLERGRVDCDVASDPQRQFSVVVRGVEVRVTGTRFSVELSPDRQRVSVSVERGSVEVLRGNTEVPVRRLAAGEQWSVSLLADERVEQVAPPAIEDEATSEQPPVGTAVAEAEVVAAPNAADEHAPRAAPPAPSGVDRDTDAPSSIDQASARELLDLGNAARRAGDAAGAARVYQMLLDKYPGDARAGLAAFELGRLKMDRLGDYPGAVTALRLAVARASGSGFREDAMARLVNAHAAMGARAACRTARQAYLRDYPKGVHAATVARKCEAR